MAIARMDSAQKDSVAKLLDKLTVQSLHLMEEKLERRRALEAAIAEGTFHLAKSRYIMGQNTVSASQLPADDSRDFSASAVCEHVTSNGCTQLQVVQNKSEDTLKPMKWFGVLLPQNLHRAQSMFQSAVYYAAECANTHIRLSDALNKIKWLKNLKAKCVVCK